jgi:hypothetical protein
VILNIFYIWSYKFSGATEIQFVVVGLGGLYLDLSNFIMLLMGIYFLTIAINIYDIVDFTVNREKIREKRKQKTYFIGEDGKKQKVKIKKENKKEKLENKNEIETEKTTINNEK